MMDPESQAAMLAEWHTNKHKVISGEEERHWPFTDHRLAKPVMRTVTLASIVDAVCEATGISKSMLVGRRGRKPVTDARQIAYYLMAEFCPHQSFGTIGRTLGRDHSTVLWGLRRYRVKRAVDADLRALETQARTLVDGSQSCAGRNP